METPKPVTAKLFRNGASQAVRLPKESRFDADEVCIKRIGLALLLYPQGSAWNLMAGVLGQADEDFMPDRNQPKKPDKRKPLALSCLLPTLANSVASPLSS
jgi:antitoxin VapB